MALPLCSKCAKPIGHGHLNFEGEQPVHKACYGKLPTLPAPDPFDRTPLMDRYEFEGRVSLALVILLLLAFALL